MQQFFYNPVKIYMGCGCRKILPELLEEKKCLVLTSSELYCQEVIKDTIASCGKIVDVISNIKPNPTIKNVVDTATSIDRKNIQAIVAIGGGSVIDIAKAISVEKEIITSEDELVTYLKLGKELPSMFSNIPIIAIPTTAGTGSEVTQWATIWDDVEKKKYSLSNPRLYPEVAIIDPELTITLPEETTISTALDALSHAMEAIWNKNANPISDNLALQAIKTIITDLELVLNMPNDINARTALHYASLKAGLAFSNTKTAIAHSISYPLTARFGIPHGIAASFTLPAVLEDVGKKNRSVISPLIGYLGCYTLDEVVYELYRLFKKVSISKYLRGLQQENLNNIDFISSNRAANSIITYSNKSVIEIVHLSLNRIKLGD